LQQQTLTVTGKDANANATAAGTIPISDNMPTVTLQHVCFLQLAIVFRSAVHKVKA
jgi:hypothetical protein